jgi:cobalamin biosynthesis protein CbiG
MAMTGTLAYVRQLRVSTWRFTRQSLPVLLDVAGFVAITVGVWLLAGAWAWLAAGGLLVLAGYRAQS